jgi:F-type H+-transporting ATPase subunit b
MPDIDRFHLLLAGGFWTSPAGFPKLVNLLIFLGILYYLLRRPVREFLAQRLASVRQMLERAAKEKEIATMKMAELDARLNRLDAELTGIREQAGREAAAERERMKAETERDIEKLRLTTNREIEAAKQVAMADLREYAATKSVEFAEQIIRRELTPEDDARLLRRVSEEMDRVK